MPERKTITDLFIRTCRDSGFGLDCYRAAAFVGNILHISAFEVYLAIGSLDAMQKVAAGTHPACRV